MPNLRHRSTPKDLPGSWKSPAFIVLCLVTAQVTACAHSPSVKSEGEELSASAAAAPSEVARHKASTSPTATHERHAGEHHHGVEAGEIEHGYDALRRKYTHHDHPEHNDDLEGDDHSLHVPTVSCKLHDYEDESPPALEGGAWEGVFPAEGSSAVHNILGMQTVHVVMLPSGKLLLISGSSWRNRNGIQYFPKYEDPETPAGLFIREEDPFRNEKLDEYYELVNNAAIYDPVDNTFYRVNVPNPEPDPHVPDHFAPNDFFCTGHQHLPNGNVLFTGGTQYYSPYRTGNNTSYIFNWRTELEMDWKHIDWRRRPVSNDGSPWIFSGFMKRGRWYPSLVPLLDGRLAIFSGYVGFDEGFPPMYTFEINSWIEVFDPDKFDPGNLDLAWKAVDAAGAPDGPFTHEINPDFKPTPGVACPERCLESNKYDAFKLYPQNYLQPDGRIYLTREGDWVSLRTCDAAFMRKTKATYFMSLEEQNGDLKLDFDRGPDRPQDVTSYAVVNPIHRGLCIRSTPIARPTTPRRSKPLILQAAWDRHSSKPSFPITALPVAAGLSIRPFWVISPKTSEPCTTRWRCRPVKSW